MYNRSTDEKLFIMTYTLYSGIKSTVPLSNKQISEWIECFKLNKNFITTIGQEKYGLKPCLVADFKVHNNNVFSEK